ncbi:MAG: hypothetical protein AAFN10_16790 [Bacteroidota bacterium]
MQIIKVELLSDKALKLLQQLEQLNVLRLIGAKDDVEEEQAPVRNWAGSISSESAKRLLSQVEKSRNEWERDI